MSQDPQNTLPTIYPYFSYQDAAAAVRWLVAAFGFEQTALFAGPDGVVLHAELHYGAGAIMLGTMTAEQHAQPRPAVSFGPGVYVYVADVDAHYTQAKAAGATIVYPPEDTEFGTRRYRALDLEGNEWSFGTYRPTRGS